MFGQKMAYVVVILLMSGCFGRSKGQRHVIKNPLTIERLYSSPKIDGEQPKSVKISPNGKRITYLKGRDDNFRILDLWEWDVQAGAESLIVDSVKLLGDDKEELSDEEKARRERKRVQHKGIVEYYWSEQGDKILFPLNGDLYLYTVDSEKPVTRLTDTEDAELDARFSPKGTYISFVRKHNLYILDLVTKVESQVTFAGTKDKPMAIAEFVAQEEMSRHRGYWWSPNEEYIALTQVDETPVGIMTRLEAYPSGIKVVEQRYPRTGEVNAIVRLGVVKLFEKGVQWIQLGAEDYYIPHVRWLKNEVAPALTFMLQTRDQKKLDLVHYSPKSKKQRVLITEKDRAWVDIRHDHIYLKNQEQILWLSEKSGYHHIHRFDLQGNELEPLTKGEWEVTDLHSVDEEKGKVYFSATLESPMQRHLYSVDLNKAGDPVKLTERTGIHRISMAQKPTLFIDNFSSLEQPPYTTVHDMEGKVLFSLTKNKVDKDHPLMKYRDDLAGWEFNTLRLREGEDLYYKILKPKDFDPRKKYPLVHYVYGGPGVQLVNKSWAGRGGLFHQLLAQKGFIVLVSDNRGTPNRGRDFEREYYLKLGRLEVADQAAVLEHVLKHNEYIDEKRVGVYGHSYGGYLTLMMLFQRPDLYHVGVSGAPVVDWKLYDTHYTERFLGHPRDNEAFYLKSNVLTYANSFRGRLLVLHGMADDNVLYNHSLMLYQELQKKGKVFDIMAYPGAKHGIRGKEREIHYHASILQYFTDHLVKGI